VTGVAGNVYTLAVAKQTAKGTPATASTGYKLKLTSGDVSPQRQLLTLQETDATRQQGQTVVVGGQIDGTPEWYVRPDDFGLFAFGALGANADASMVHTATPAIAPPYFTVWKNIGAGTIVDKYQDCRIGSLEISGGAGQAIMCKAEIKGLSATFGATDSTAPLVTQQPFTYPMASVSLGGATPNTVENFTVMINNNVDFIQADNSLGPYDVVPGRLEISGSFTYLLQDDVDYRKFHTGTGSGTALTPIMFSEAIAITLTNGATSIAITLAGAALTAYPVPPDVSGKPIRVAATFTALPQTTPAGYCSIVTTNTVATY